MVMEARACRGLQEAEEGRSQKGGNPERFERS